MFQSITETVSPECLDLIHRLLEKDSAKRISWEEFFSHPFLNGISQRRIYCVPTGEGYQIEITQETK